MDFFCTRLSHDKDADLQCPLKLWSYNITFEVNCVSKAYQNISFNNFYFIESMVSLAILLLSARHFRKWLES